MHYAAYGRALDSAIALPELEAVPAAPPHWRVCLAAGPAPALPPGARTTGAEALYDGVRAALARVEGGWRITVDDTGTFDWDAARRTVTCRRFAHGTDDFLRAHLLGRVLATTLHDDGDVLLHASAVVTAAGAVAFVAPKGWGKSTLALALANAGAPLLTDDTLPVSPGTPPVAWPGLHSLRLHDDAVAALGAAATDVARDDGKRLARPAARVPLAREPVPLAALHLLLPAAAIDGGAVAARVPLAPTQALAGVLGNARSGEMLGADGQPELLRRVAALARAVPVAGLVVARDLARMPEVAALVLGWHGGPPAGVAP
jgi:hypothetical protein